MSDIVIDEQEEKPLDPVMENVRRKMVRLQLISGGIMLVMFMAVLAAIVYKLTADVPSDGPLTGSVALPDGFVVSAVSYSDGQVLFYGIFSDGRRKAIAYDIASGRIAADIDITGN